MEIETRVALTSPLPYAARDGNMREASFVTLRAPTSAAYRTALRIKQEMLRAIFARSAQGAASATAGGPADEDVDAEAEAERPTGPQYLAMLAATTADVAMLAELFRDLVTAHGVALVDGEFPMTALLLDRLSMADFEAIFGEYLARFPLA